FLRFQIEELRSAGLAPDEDERLQAEKQLLQSAETRVQAAEAARQALDSEEDGLLNGLRSAIARLRALSQLDPQAVPLREGLERSLAEAEEVSLSIHRYLGAVDQNPERLVQVQDRLSLIADLRRKYGTGVREMLETLARLE